MWTSMIFLLQIYSQHRVIEACISFITALSVLIQMSQKLILHKDFQVAHNLALHLLSKPVDLQRPFIEIFEFDLKINTGAGYHLTFSCLKHP